MILGSLVCYGHLLFLDYLRGTPYLNIFYNLLGARISLSAYLDTVDITGYDLVEIQANSVVLSGAGIHAHSLEGLFFFYLKIFGY